MPDVLAWCPTTNASARLTPSGVSGGQSELFWFIGAPHRCAALPKGGKWLPSHWNKVRALIELADPTLDAAFPEELLLDPRDRTSPLGFAMKKFSGIPHTQIVVPAERAAQKLDWGPRELREVGLQFARLFARFERLGITQNDAHGGNYLIDWPPRARHPRVYRVDALSFGFHWQGSYYGCDKAVFEYVAPELHGRALADIEFTREADRYSLACLLFPLLTEGGYPWNFAHAKGTPAARVARKEFAMFTNPRGTRVPPVVEAAFNRLPHEVIVLFERAFLGDPATRPGPREWTRALKLIDARGPTRRRFGTWRAPALEQWARKATQSLRNHARANRWMLTALTCAALAWMGLPRRPGPQPTDPEPVRTVAPAKPAPDPADAPNRATGSGAKGRDRLPEIQPPAPNRKPINPNGWQNID